MEPRALAELAADPDGKLDADDLARALMEEVPRERWPELARLLGEAGTVVGLHAVEHLED